MKINLIALLVMVSVYTIMQTQAKPLKALLYCFIPFVNQQNPLPQYEKLAKTINRYLLLQNINVEVQICNAQLNGTYLYDQQLINDLFEPYDIMQIDVLMLHAIKAQLMSFKIEEIDYYDSVFQFQWQPTTRVNNGHTQLIGSPSLICSYFVLTRKDRPYEDRLYGDFSKENSVELTILYINTFINLGANRTIQSVNYEEVDNDTIGTMALFLKDCQNNNTVFDYNSNWCLKPLQFNFIQTNYSKYVNYSEFLFPLQTIGVDSSNLEAQNLVDLIPHKNSNPKKIYFIDSLIAKKQADRRTVLQFYKFMLSDKIIDLYVKGVYTNSPKTTYLIPPTISYMSSLRTDRIYQSFISNDFQKSQILPIYQEAYLKGMPNLGCLIDEALKKYSDINPSFKIKETI